MADSLSVQNGIHVVLLLRLPAVVESNHDENEKKGAQSYNDPEPHEGVIAAIIARLGGRRGIRTRRGRLGRSRGWSWLRFNATTGALKLHSAG